MPAESRKLAGQTSGWKLLGRRRELRGVPGGVPIDQGRTRSAPFLSATKGQMAVMYDNTITKIYRQCILVDVTVMYMVRITVMYIVIFTVMIVLLSRDVYCYIHCDDILFIFTVMYM